MCFHTRDKPGEIEKKCLVAACFLLVLHLARKRKRDSKWELKDVSLMHQHVETSHVTLCLTSTCRQKTCLIKEGLNIMYIVI